MLRWIKAPDKGLMRRLHKWEAPRWVRTWMSQATRGGDGWLWYAAGAAVLLFGDENKWRALGAAAVAALVSVILFMCLKKVTARPRPCEIEPHCWWSSSPPDQYSFPSGHSMAAFAVSVPLMLVYPAMTIGLLFCAASVAASRIVLGLHYLSDVVAGSMLGAALGYWAYTLFL
jgi:undecaprenyl-diphosphatase